jgi:ParB family chromosome partitioning protein
MAEEARRRNLGRGLDALLGESRSGSAGDAGAASGVLTLPIEQVYPGRSQPRTIFAQTEIDELADSIRQLGILQPLIVRPHPTRTGSYEIIAGERRWRAAQQARLHEVPALVRELSDGEALEIALVENLQRENLSPVEEAEAYRRLMDEFSHTQEALAKIVGKSRSHVANMLRLLQLPANAKEMLMDGRLTAGHARALLGASNPSALAEAIVKRGLNVRQAEKQARGNRRRVPSRAAHRPRLHRATRRPRPKIPTPRRSRTRSPRSSACASTSISKIRVGASASPTIRSNSSIIFCIA